MINDFRFCVLIPTRGRAQLIAKTFLKMPWLISKHTILGIETGEVRAYEKALAQVAGSYKITRIMYDNPSGSVAVAREYLRAAAVRVGYDYYVVTDDNAIHQSALALNSLVTACHHAQRVFGPSLVAGMHNTASHFDRGKIGKAKWLVDGITVYPSVAMIFQCYPHGVYSAYQYPPDAYGLDDRHFFLWCLNRGITQFHVCMEAKFTKARYQAGGQGSLDDRAWKTGMAIARLATDFPKLVGAVGTLRIPWQFLIDAAEKGGSYSGTRLVGGAMRKESVLQASSTRLKVKVRKSPTTEKR